MPIAAGNNLATRLSALNIPFAVGTFGAHSVAVANLKPESLDWGIRIKPKAEHTKSSGIFKLSADNRVANAFFSPGYGGIQGSIGVVLGDARSRYLTRLVIPAPYIDGQDIGVHTAFTLGAVKAFFLLESEKPDIPLWFKDLDMGDAEAQAAKEADLNIIKEENERHWQRAQMPMEIVFAAESLEVYLKYKQMLEYMFPASDGSSDAIATGFMSRIGRLFKRVCRISGREKELTQLRNIILDEAYRLKVAARKEEIEEGIEGSYLWASAAVYEMIAEKLILAGRKSKGPVLIPIVEIVSTLGEELAKSKLFQDSDDDIGSLSIRKIGNIAGRLSKLTDDRIKIGS